MRTLLHASLLALPSCKTHSQQWSFAVTRSAYGGSHSGYSLGHHGYHGGEGESVALLVLLFLPVAIDLVFLPVALTHDLCD